MGKESKAETAKYKPTSNYTYCYYTDTGGGLTKKAQELYLCFLVAKRNSTQRIKPS
ncbi:hypothetical protein [uncultured Pontibacter sp.]|uniref:hypothetical protein n=1 Tax=uncultured Pontibacter sp. TaxID=453356 RepID=UPI00262A12F9|nr:hypothetical protein [uncultured Pontibacter sp.]